MGKKEIDAPELFINRELSWLEFNDRVLREGLSETVPLLDRLKFLAIVSSNLDEFFMIRVAGLMQQRGAGIRKRDFSGMTPHQQLGKISARVHQMVTEQTAGIKEVLGQLHDHGLHLVGSMDWSPRQKRNLQNYFDAEVQPVLTPILIQESSSSPLLPSLQLYVAILLTSEKAKESSSQIVVIPVPSQNPRFIQIPSDKDVHLALLEEVIAEHIHQMFPEHQVSATASFRITRDADVEIQDDDAGDLLGLIEKAVLDRRRRQAIRLEISSRPDKRIKKWLTDWLQLKPADTYEIDGLLDAKALMEIAFRSGFESLKDPDWPPQLPRDLIGSEDLWQTIRDHDVMLFHPYESFDPVIQLIQEAAEDANVLAIKQTLYRTSGDSPIIQALEQAATNGKQVTVLVELKARFDEARNVIWSRRLEDAGCLVIYGIAGYKTHSKATLIVRREGNRIRRYVHLATGNYNDKTAKLYSDIGIMTCDNNIATDVSSFFNLLTGYSEVVGWSELAIAPTDLRRRCLELIEREIQTSTPEQPGMIWAKVNSLQDKKIIQALYRASRKGVQIKLNVRGICCLRPGLKKYSKNIEVVSIIDRYLEHPRIFYFYHAGHEEVYLSSADWMTRNLDKRLEILFPIKDPNHRRRLIHYLETYFADNTKSHRLLDDGTYEKIICEKKPVRAQEYFYQAAVDAQKTTEKNDVRFQPLTRPKE
jgi:polyphosphate kinase